MVVYAQVERLNCRKSSECTYRQVLLAPGWVTTQVFSNKSLPQLQKKKKRVQTNRPVPSLTAVEKFTKK